MKCYVCQKELKDMPNINEKTKMYPDVPVEDCEIVCRDCFTKIMDLKNGKNNKLRTN